MRKDYLEIINNLKAAVRIGHTESILAAIGAIGELLEIKSNAPVAKPLLEKLIIPAGKTLRSRMVQWETIKHVRQSHLTGIRALMAGAAASRWLVGYEVKKKDIKIAGQDSRKEVRDVLVSVLKTADEDSIDALWKLTKNWLIEDSPRIQQVAILLLPAFMQERKSKVFKKLSSDMPNGNPEINAALVEILIEFGNTGFGTDVVALLTDWANAEKPNGWVICKTISSSWAVNYKASCEAIMHSIQSKVVDERLLERTFAALERNTSNKTD